MKKYRRLSRNDRDEIAVLINRRWHLRKIAIWLNRSHRRPRHARPWPNRLIPQRVSIHHRPVEINLRQVPGHWETDLVLGFLNHSAFLSSDHHL